MDSAFSLRSLFALTALATNVAAFSMSMPVLAPIEMRQVQGAPQGNNTFASIVPGRTLEWTPCYQDSPSAALGELSCARLIAPMDYEDPTAGEVQLAIIKLGAPGNCPVTRTVFVNPGGPGVDPVTFVNSAGAIIRAQVGNDSDIIGVVPRGVGSTFPPITCDPVDLVGVVRGQDITNALPGYSNTSLNEIYAAGESLGADCGVTAPNLIQHIGTMSVARDMNFVLEALGQEKLSYLGYSYGTVLGATFAAMFPDKVDRMVLDAVVDSADYYKLEKDPLTYLENTDNALNNFYMMCLDAGPESCPIFEGSWEAIRDRVLAVDRRIMEKPFPVPGLGLLKAGLWRQSLFNALYRPMTQFALFAGIIAEIEANSPGPAIQEYAKLVGALSTPVEPPLVDPATGLKNALVTSTRQIICADGGANEEQLGPEQLEAISNRYRSVSEIFGGSGSQHEFVCQGARLAAKERPAENLFQNVRTSSPILWVGNTADPITPLRNAQRMSQVFEGSGLLQINGTGHCSFEANPGMDCAARFIVPYFRDGTLPPPGASCAGQQAPFG